jgi:pyrroloquinoline-quinone synthase
MNTGFKKKIIEAIEHRSILKHPFYVKWNEGKLTIDELRKYARQYYKWVENFPMLVSAVHSNCRDDKVRKLLMENLADEEGFKSAIQPHPVLWLNFCAALGLYAEPVRQATPIKETQKMVSGYYDYCRSSDYRIGVAALLAYEYQIPEVSRVKIEGLKKFYGINSKRAFEFFAVHEEADIQHREAEMNILLEKCDDREQEKFLEVIDKAAGLYWQMLDGLSVS